MYTKQSWAEISGSDVGNNEGRCVLIRTRTKESRVTISDNFFRVIVDVTSSVHQTVSAFGCTFRFYCFDVTKFDLTSREFSGALIKKGIFSSCVMTH